MTDDPTLAEILSAPACPQEAGPDDSAPPIQLDHPLRVVFLYDQGADFVRGKIEPVIGRGLGNGLAWLHFSRADGSAGALVALHSYASPGEFELSVVANRGLICRTVLRCTARWVFEDLGAQRLVLRLRPGFPLLADLALRAGFKIETVARSFFEDGESAVIWSMLRDDCPWLPRKALAIPTIDISPPSSTTRH